MYTAGNLVFSSAFKFQERKREKVVQFLTFTGVHDLRALHWIRIWLFIKPNEIHDLFKKLQNDIANLDAVLIYPNPP